MTRREGRDAVILMPGMIAPPRADGYRRIDAEPGPAVPLARVYRLWQFAGGGTADHVLSDAELLTVDN